MRRHTGFTLIEVMIVVAIIAILSAIAVPNYSEYVLRSRLTDGISALAGMRVKMEQYFQDNRRYDGTPAACSKDSIAPLPTANNFTFDCGTPTATTYVITATGSGPLNGFVYTLNQDNTRTTTGVITGWSNGNCGWVMKKDGSC
jgi:type IV pilus assembly protein PilE